MLHCLTSSVSQLHSRLTLSTLQQVQQLSGLLSSALHIIGTVGILCNACGPLSMALVAQLPFPCARQQVNAGADPCGLEWTCTRGWG